MSVTFYHLTDLHILAKSNWESDPYTTPRFINQIAYLQSEEILMKAVDTLLADTSVDTVLVTGDLTSIGDRESHEIVVRELRRLRDGGKKVYAFIASHDFPWKGCEFYVSKEGLETRSDKRGTTFEEAQEYYREFGYDEAIAKDPINYSFVVDLDEKTRYIALCVDYYEEHFPGVDAHTKAWLKEQSALAKAANKKIVLACHHPLLPPVPIYKLMGAHDMVKESDELVEFLASIDIHFVLTGHTHMHDAEYKECADGLFFDVATASLAGFPPVMRKVTYDPDSGDVSAQTIVLKELKTDKFDIDDLKDYCREGCVGFIEDMITCMGEDVGKFAVLSKSMSINPDDVLKHRHAVRFFGKFINKLTFGRVGNWTRKETGYKRSDYADIKKERIVPFLLKAVEALFAGNPDVDPLSKEYRIFLGFVAILDSVVRCLHINLEKLLGYATLAEIIHPLVYNNGIDDVDTRFNLYKKPEPRVALPELKSRKGGGIIAITVLAALVLLPFAVAAGVLFGVWKILSLPFSKKSKNKKEEKKDAE